MNGAPSPILCTVITKTTLDICVSNSFFIYAPPPDVDNTSSLRAAEFYTIWAWSERVGVWFFFFFFFFYEGKKIYSCYTCWKWRLLWPTHSQTCLLLMVISSEQTCTFSCFVITIYQVGCGSSIMNRHFYLWQFVAEPDQESEGGESSVLAFVESCWLFGNPCFCVFIEAPQPSFVVVCSCEILCYC